MMTKAEIDADDPKALGWLRMKELMAATGLPKSTILHYANEGLLPDIHKTGRNMAYYHPSTVDRIAFIREAQEKHRLPLTSIKRVLEAHEKGHDISILLQLQEAIFGSHNQKMTKRAFLKATGMTEEQLKVLLKVGVLIPLEDGRFDAEDAAIGHVLKTGLDYGFDPQSWTFYVQLANQIVDHEMEHRQQATKDLPFEKDAEVTLSMTRAARALRGYVIDRTFQKRIMKLKNLKDHESPKGGRS
jgi:DNA-binding transcriptional MerR regulator